ncbi:PREDICTED: monocarboxylate transporter 3 [Papilio xuthus]|uniref:Monocarboxylate transporter 12-B n=1 Tax=Papilio xuthus TaxID=66420 RepID=A0A194PKU4_PAPXU|nr:PREDICTED: monocarboxylate transporter 3 [Papilio xuthus]XP_013173423.1 PREDICTED: monocarboxylate transporter 3 [Papilio xuthus]XP_013173424.1 PREDICTED: monocarboxylate transporter 3 [Papilio xuthus]KPI94056.1 Monocarboxylate transporter 12-B [Papilio xuthus]
MVVRVATDERPFETPSSDESGLGRSDSPSDDVEPEAALVVPPDGGWGWVVVAASFMCNVIVDGIIFCNGLLVTEIQKEFGVSEGAVAPVSSILTGFYLLSGPFVSALANKYGFRSVTIVGSLISSVAFTLSYFATSVEYLYLVYGLLGGIGFCMIYMPAVLTVGFYFERWRALATGLSLCGSGVGTFIFAPLSNMVIAKYGWRWTMVIHAGFILVCVVCGAMFRPIKPVRVTLADQTEEEDTARRHEEAVEKLNSMIKLHSKLDSGIAMPPEMRFTNRVSPHTWMGVANNTRYPTAEEIFKGSNSHLGRRSSATAGTMKNLNKPMFITGTVAEKDEQEDSNSNIDNAEPLIAAPIKVVSRDARPRRSHADLVARPLYRDDIFFGASLARLPQYTSRTSLGYHLAVTHLPTQEDVQEDESGKCTLCPEAVRRALATMLDVSLFKSPTFIILAISGFFTMLGFFVPYMYVKKRAEENGMSMDTSVMLVSVIGIANIVGRIACGLVSSMPRISPLWLNNIALSAGGIATMLSGLWFDNTYQFSYCVAFGLAVACFSSLRSILVVEYIGLEQLTNCFGLFLLFQGLGALLSAPIGGILRDMTDGFEASFYASGAFLLFSAMMCYPVDYISRWEKSRNKLTTTPKV